MSRTRLWCALAVALVSVLAACSAAGPPAAEGPRTASSTREDVVRFVTPFVVRSLDPIQQGFWSPEWGYGEMLMRATEEGQVEPWLLERLTPESPTSWKLVLRPNVTFANGRKLDARTLKAVFDRHIAANPLVEERIPGVEVKVLDGGTLRLTTAEPVADLPNLLADEQMISVFDVEAVARAGQDVQELVGQGIYTGPFDVTKLSAEEMVLERNEDYWGGEVVLAGARVRFVPDGQARVLAVRGGEADVALYPPTELLGPLRTAKAGPRMALARQPLQQLRAFLNLHKLPMRDRAVRQAIAAGIDYQAIAEEVLDGIYSTPTGLFPESMSFAQPTQQTNTARARDLLEDAGWRVGTDGVRSKGGVPLAIRLLTYPQQPDTRTIAVAMESQLRPLGFDVDISEVPNNYEAMEDRRAWDVGLSFDGTLGYTYDPVAPLHDFLTTHGSRNFGGVADPDLDALVARLSATTGSAERSSLLADVQRIIADQCYTVIVAQRSSPAVVSATYGSYRPSSVLHHLTATTRSG
ncbi:ABC transporter substrate-binding protein [Actinopolymorpha pittospori]|uniref:Peptide/nickel transport system substrate-binding protein n=1 Tax=Actinopolymorpha pittospori TaxID=648752 RepID=A0A927MMJ3_9ACTN|nr:ABC transporter substrate-binding protein [Actinopolymorpha pittospori]MBE1603425.1 peptide/nickel transport system substrate-binding protein [Actinopolymorpha pittospori]